MKYALIGLMAFGYNNIFIVSRVHQHLLEFKCERKIGQSVTNLNMEINRTNNYLLALSLIVAQCNVDCKWGNLRFLDEFLVIE